MPVSARNRPKKVTKGRPAPARKRKSKGSAKEDIVFSVPFTGEYPQLDANAKLLPLFAC